MKKTKKFIANVLNIALPIVLALLFGAICLLIVGKNPLDVYGYLVRKTLLDGGGFMNSLGYATPILMTGIATALSYTANVYNMGIEGQMYMGAFFATFLGWTLQGLPSWLHITICLAGGALAGMAYAMIPAILKAVYRINEVVTTIMLNSIAIIFTAYLTNGPFSDNVGFAATFPIAKSAQISRIISRYRVTYAIFIAVAIIAIIWFLERKTRFGYEIKTLGRQQEFADAVGMEANKKIILIFLIGGAIGGIAGATEMMGVNIRFTPSWSTNPGLGWDGQAVCLLAHQNPIAILITGVLFGAFKYGGVTLQSNMGVSLDIINIIKSSLILFLAAQYVYTHKGWFKELTDWIENRKPAVKQNGEVQSNG